MIITRPVDSTREPVDGFRWQGISGKLHDSLLAAKPSGEAPSCDTGARLLVRSPCGAQRRLALSTVGVPRVTAGPRRTHAGRQRRRASRAMNQQPPRVHRRSIQDHRHTGSCASQPSEQINDTRMVHQ
ncbi:hypothetical protein HMPREF0591_4654 [Mycobacterium parascrofulaceum ATCC BAA-614]|uniref:Uncharacterized protein n=1 Tax=Mycobacterium parascrofulaceum ATCC BAA-614 TaxID=525368 RepID=D5PEH7_9MYCO|nr:hypothetical protein HMPREF0591_4654 [Mycobacterium parascrofulaceum ATCC BAA-614]